MTVDNVGIFRTLLKHQDIFQQRYEKHLGWQPVDVEIRVNLACNAKCKMCGIESYMEEVTDARKKLMTTNEICSLIRELKTLGCQSLTFSGGEPLLRKDIVDLVEFAAKKSGIRTSINTNGILLNTRKIYQLIEAGLDHFTFSILSPVDSVNDSIMVINKGLKRLADTIDYINALKRAGKKSVKVYVNTVILRENIETLSFYNEFFRQHPVNHVYFSPASINTEWDEWTATDDELRPSLNQIRKLERETLPELNRNELNLTYNNPFGTEEEEIKRNLHGVFSREATPCYVPMIHSVIQSNGDVIPCCYAPDEFFMGNVLDKSFRTIWQGGKYVKFRLQAELPKWSMCNSCNQYKKVNKIINQKVKENKND